MIEYEKFSALAIHAANVFLLAISVTLIITICLQAITKLPRQETLRAFFVIGGISSIGAMVGELGGLSRDGVVGDVVPAALTLIGAYSVYLFGEKKSKDAITNVSVFSFVLSMFLAYNYSSMVRTDIERFNYCLDLYSNQENYSNKDFKKKVLEENIFCDTYFAKFIKI